MSATQPTATTATVASTLSRAPSFENTIRTPLGVFSKASMAPKFSRTTMPASRKAAATAADTSSSVDRMRWPASRSWTREPKPLKIEATCTPVAPAPTTNIDGGNSVRPQASLWVAVSSKPGIGSRRLVPPAQRMMLSANSQPTPGFDRVRIDEACGAGRFVDRHSHAVEVLAPSRMRAHIADDLADAREEPGIGKDRLTHGDAVQLELASLPDQPDSVSQCSNRHWSVIGRHAAKFVAGDERRLGAQAGGTVRGENPGRSCANDDDVRHSILLSSAIPVRDE